MHGHSSFIFSLAVLPNNDIVSGGEDRALKIWSGNNNSIELTSFSNMLFVSKKLIFLLCFIDGNCKQTIMLPNTVWCVAAMENGDIVTATSDAVARIWTKDPQRSADELKLAEYDAKLAAVAIPRYPPPS